MADPQLLAYLKEGRGAAWQELNPGKRIDLSCSNLTDLYLGGLNLREANLRDTVLGDLSNVDLSNADLTNARFGHWRSESEAREDYIEPLRPARLTMVKFAGATMDRVQMRQATAFKCTFERATAHGAVFEQAVFFDCKFDSIRMGAELPPVAASLANAAPLSGELRVGGSWPIAPNGSADLRGIRCTQCSWRNAVLDGASIADAHLEECDLSGASLVGASLYRARLSQAKLIGANCAFADFTSSDLTAADLTDANARRASFAAASMGPLFITHCSDPLPPPHQGKYATVKYSFVCTRLVRANLDESSLVCASLVRADLSEASIRKAWTFGVSAWNVKLDGCVQGDLMVTEPGQAPAYVDSLDMAQLVHMLLSNGSVRRMIDTATSKLVLILGRFGSSGPTPPLLAIRRVASTHGFAPILFDFDRPISRSTDETMTCSPFPDPGL